MSVGIGLLLKLNPHKWKVSFHWHTQRETHTPVCSTQVGCYLSPLRSNGFANAGRIYLYLQEWLYCCYLLCLRSFRVKKGSWQLPLRQCTSVNIKIFELCSSFSFILFSVFVHSPRWRQPFWASHAVITANFLAAYFHSQHGNNKCKTINPFEAPRFETAGHFHPIFWLVLTC